MFLDPTELDAAIAAIDRTRIFQGLSEGARSEMAAASEFMRLDVGEHLFKEGSGAGALYLLAQGKLNAVEPDATEGPRRMRIIVPGEAVDGLQELGGPKKMFVSAEEPSLIAVVPDSAVDQLAARFSDVREVLARIHRRQSLTSLRRIFGPLDEALMDTLERSGEWINLRPGEVVFEPGTRSDGLYFVIRGRVAALQVTTSGDEQVDSYRTRGETIGEAGFLTGRRRQYRARTTRDTVLVKYASAALEALIGTHPQVVRYMARAISIRASMPERVARTASISTICFISASKGSSVREVADKVAAELDRHSSVLQLNSARVDALGGEPGLAQAADGSFAEQRLLTLLERCEAEHRFVLYTADDEPSAWSRRCARQADRHVLVADRRELQTATAVERDIMSNTLTKREAYATLILVHPDGTQLPAGTRYWLRERPYVSDHYHVRAGSDADIARVARLVSGRGMGLVLGGGGARGFAHIGLIKALEESGIPVDVVGGTSMGAFIGGQYAMGRSIEEIREACKRVFLGVRPHRGFNLPVFSLVGRARVEEAGRVAFGNVEIEDLWRSYFCVSANLTTAEVMVHRSGKLRHGATASANLPGVSVPVIHERNLLVDGGVLNNLPTDVMRRLGGATVVASIVSAQVASAFTCERVPSVWEMVRGQVTGRRTASFPTIVEVMMRSVVLHSSTREKANALDADLAIRPEVAGFGLLAFDRMDDIIEAGYRAGLANLPTWKEQSRGSLD